MPRVCAWLAGAAGSGVSRQKATRWRFVPNCILLSLHFGTVVLLYDGFHLGSVPHKQIVHYLPSPLYDKSIFTFKLSPY